MLASKGNSTAGCTALQIAGNKTSLLAMQQKRCSFFDAFDDVFSESPNVKPVHPIEVGHDGDDELPDSQNTVDEVFEGRAPSPDGVTPYPHRAPCRAPSPVLARAGAAPPLSKAATAPSAALAPQAALAPSAGLAPQAGKPAAAFHLAPSKKEKKVDLGEAYLKAQTARIESASVSAQLKNRTDLVIALTLQGKTAEEIRDFLALLGAVL